MIEAVVRALRRRYTSEPSPVADFQRVRTHDPFRVLVATILSARTKDATTSAVCVRLFERVSTLEALQAVPVAALERLIYPVGFYRTKARHLHALPEVVAREFGGRIPHSIEELVRLPGVGRKTANLVVTDAFGGEGLCVDVHVHRISNRLGLIRTRTPAESEHALRALLPKRYWSEWNPLLVAFGQTVCRPRSPSCASCPLARRCAYWLRAAGNAG
ncbi:MAG: endonuclease III domain-containing protein [Kiritimatiellia bacterium]